MPTDYPIEIDFSGVKAALLPANAAQFVQTVVLPLSAGLTEDEARQLVEAATMPVSVNLTESGHDTVFAKAHVFPVSAALVPANAASFVNQVLFAVTAAFHEQRAYVARTVLRGGQRMSRGDSTISFESLATNATLVVQPPAAEQWQILRLFLGDACTVSVADGSIHPMKLVVPVSGVQLDFSAAPLFLTNTHYLTIKNTGSEAAFTVFGVKQNAASPEQKDESGNTLVSAGSGVGDWVAPANASVSAGQSLTIQPPQDEEWDLYNLFVDQVGGSSNTAYEVHLTDGTTDYTFQTGTLPDDDTNKVAALRGLKIRLTHDFWMTFKNGAGGARYMTYEALRVKKGNVYWLDGESQFQKS